MSSGSFKNVINKTCLEIIYLIYMYKKDLALNNLQELICHKSKPSPTNSNKTNFLCIIYFFLLFLTSFEVSSSSGENILRRKVFKNVLKILFKNS